MNNATAGKDTIMKAVRYHAYGDSDVLVYEDAARPVAGPGQVVVAVGGYATQLAARAGATVTVTASAGSRDRVRSYGAHQLVDYTTTTPGWRCL